MADGLFIARSNSLIGGRFEVDTAQSLADAGGGVPAFVARDRMAADGRRVALAVSRDASPRAKPLRVLNEHIDNLMLPLGHGVAPLAAGKGVGYFVICTTPPGPPLSAALTQWSEKMAIELVLRPVSQVLARLQLLDVTHRAIRLNNVFQAAEGQPVTLGAGWAAPASMHQPMVFESPYSAMCHPAARGDGSIADDVYALGVLLLTLIAGRLPMANLDDVTMIRWKLDIGSFAALTRDIGMSGAFGDLLRGMLAEDPDHRPPPGSLMELANSRGRRVATRPARRSQTALMLNDAAVFDARALAYELTKDEKRAVQFLRSGAVTQWLRRSLGDASVATQVEDLLRGRVAETGAGPLSDALLLMHTVSTLDPLMPLCWRGVMVWPDALASLLAAGIASDALLLALIEELLVNDIAGAWAAADSRRAPPDYAELVQQQHLLQGGGADGLLRLFYGWNPLLPCRVASMATGWIISVADLMRFLEGAAATAGDSVIDRHIAAFIAARGDRKFDARINGLFASKDAASFRMNELVLLQDLQARYHPEPMPGLAKWAAGRLRPDLERWRNKPRREALGVRLDVLAQAGVVGRLLELTGDTAARAQDIGGAYLAAGEVARIDAELAAMDTGDKVRLAAAERFGQVIAGGIGLSALILMLMAVLF